jgi:hypothetical protein
MAGTGKSTIAHTIARAYFEQGRLAASFFFSRGGGDAGNARKFVTTIAMQLAVHIPSVQPYVCDAITERPTIASMSLWDQWRQLVLRPLLKLGGNDTYPLFIVIIDALDECEDEDDIRIILRLLVEARSLKDVRLRVLNFETVPMLKQQKSRRQLCIKETVIPASGKARARARRCFGGV